MGKKKAKKKAKRQSRGGAATKWTPKKHVKFLGVLAECGNVSESCKQTPISREAAYRERKRSDKFREAWELALEVAADALEAEARRRAFGYLEPLHHQGLLTGHTVKKFSDVLLIFLLKGNKPEKFADRHKVDGNLRTENTVIYLPDNGRK